MREGEISLENLDTPHDRTLAKQFGADISDFEVEEGDPDGEAKLEKYWEERKEKLIAQCREIAAELDDSEEEHAPITEEELDKLLEKVIAVDFKTEDEANEWFEAEH